MRTLEQRDQDARELNKFIGGMMVGAVTVLVVLGFIGRFAIHWHALCQAIR